MSFEEQSQVGAQLRGDGWRTLLQPRIVQAYLAGVWMDVPATDVNEQSREIRVEYSTVDRGVRKFILDASQYRPCEGLFELESDRTPRAESVVGGRSRVQSRQSAVAPLLMSYPPVEPTPQQFLDRAFAHVAGRVISDDGNAQFRVMDQNHQTSEFQGSRDQCIVYVERAWWLAATASSPRGESQKQDHAVALAFDRRSDRTASWERDRWLTNTVLHGHVGY
jgi:hypothetical protein